MRTKKTAKKRARKKVKKPVRGEIMKNFLMKNLQKILLGLLVVVVGIISAFGLGNMSAPSTYYAFGEIDTKLDYNAVAFTLELEPEEGVEYQLDSVWINVGSYDNSTMEETLVVNCYASEYNSVSLTKIATVNMTNNYETLKIGGWQSLCSGDTITKKHANYFLIAIKNAHKIKVNEVAFVGNAQDGEKVLLTATPYGAGAKEELKRALNESGELDTTDAAKLRAQSLIDEQNKFDLNLIDGAKYQNDEKGLFLQSEVFELEGVRNLKTGRSYYVNKTVNPLASYVQALGTLIFGETTLGLRFLPALFNLANIVIIFFIAKLLFNKEWLALITSYIYAIGGYSLSLATIGRIDTVLVFFLMLSLYAVLKFYRKGVSNKKFTRGQLNLLLAGASYAVAVSLKSQALYFAPALFTILVFGFIRQYGAYKVRISKSDDPAQRIRHKADYQRKAITCGCVAGVGFILLPVLILILTYLLGYASYSGYYNTTNLFSYALSNFGANFTEIISSNFTSANQLGGVLGTAVNYKAETFAINKLAFGNVIVCFIGIFSMLYLIVNAVFIFTDKKAGVAITSERKLATLMPTLFFEIAFLGTFLFQFIGGSTGVSSFYLPSVCLVFLIATLINNFEIENTKTLFKIGKLEITVARLVVFVILLASTVSFALSVAPYIGLTIDKALYSWNILHP